MSANHCHCSDQHHGRLNQHRGPHASGWKDALAGLTSPLMRLHHLRNIRSRMLQEALADLDQCKSRKLDA